MFMGCGNIIVFVERFIGCVLFLIFGLVYTNKLFKKSYFKKELKEDGQI